MFLCKFHHKRGCFGLFDGSFRGYHAHNPHKSARKLGKNHRLYLACNRRMRSISITLSRIVLAF